MSGSQTRRQVQAEEAGEAAAALVGFLGLMGRTLLFFLDLLGGVGGLVEEGEGEGEVVVVRRRFFLVGEEM